MMLIFQAKNNHVKKDYLNTRVGVAAFGLSEPVVGRREERSVQDASKGERRCISWLVTNSMYNCFLCGKCIMKDP